MISLLILVTLASIAAVTIGIYNFLSGRRLVADWRDKRRLRARSLAEWDVACQRNPRVSDVVVCLTTTPSRVGHIGDTLASLMWQTVRPRSIRLHLPEYSRRDERPYEVSPELAKLASLEIVRCEDEGPATKLLPALRDLAPDQPVLVVDDDMIYPRDMVEAFAARAEAAPDEAHALSGWVVPDDLTDRPTTLLGNVLQQPPVPFKCTRAREPRPIDVFQGYAGFLVRPRFFDLEAVADYSGAPPQARTVDDVWLSGHCQAKKSVFPHRRYPFTSWRMMRHFSESSLGRINRGEGPPETRANSIVVRHLGDRWMTSRGSE